MILAKPVTVKGANCARIGYNNLISSTANVDALPATTPNTFERWVDDSLVDMVAEFSLSAADSIDCYGIAAHNLFSAGVPTVEFAVDDGGGFVVVDTFTVIDDRPIFVSIDEQAGIQNVRFTIAAGNGLSREIAVVFTGMEMIMEQPIYGGHSPQSLSSVTEYQSTMSDTGQFLGRTITMKGTETSYSWRHLTPDFIYSEFLDFINAVKTNPFFIKPRPDYYPDDAFYCHTTSDPKPMNMGGGHRLLSVTVDVRGHSD